MAVVRVMVRMTFRQGKAKEAFRQLNQIRSGALEQKGYISGQTLINHDAPNEVLVISTWQSIDNWNIWNGSQELKEMQTELEKFLEGPVEFRPYVYSTYYAQV